MASVMEKSFHASNDLTRDPLSTTKAKIRENNEELHTYTGITFFTLSEAMVALEASRMDQKFLGGSRQSEPPGTRNDMMGKGKMIITRYNGVPEAYHY